MVSGASFWGLLPGEGSTTLVGQILLLPPPPAPADLLSVVPRRLLVVDQISWVALATDSRLG